jgi:hypothetical protein
MKADDMRTVLSYHEDFATEDTIVENCLKGRGHKVYFLPKFHCELNPIERVWAQAKVYCRAYTNFTLIRLRQIMHPALDSVTVDNIRKFARKARDYEQAYREGHKARKLWKMQLRCISHTEEYFQKTFKPDRTSTCYITYAANFFQVFFRLFCTQCILHFLYEQYE